MERRRMVRRRLLLAAEAAAAVLFLLVFCSDHGSDVGSLPAYRAPEVFCAKNLSYGTELRVRDSCGDPGAAHAAGTAGDVTLTADRDKLARFVAVGMIGRPKNPVFQGSSLTQRSTPSYCAFSIFTLSRMHALVQRYTVNLSSMVTAKRFRAPVTDLDQLLTNGDYIGYRTAGFMCPFLMNKGITEDRLNPYNNQTEYSKAPSKGSKNGGGLATVDEMVVDIPYKSPGLGSVFPDKTSPLVHDVSVDAIFNIAKGYEGSQTEDFAIDNFKTSMGKLQHPQHRIDVPRPYYGFGFLPYQGFVESSLLVPAHNDSIKPPIQWMFFKPLTKELWLTTVCFVFFIGFVFWMIERSINPVFQGSSLTQFATALYFAFSTLTFSHGQILRSPLSKIVLVVWCFAVLVLGQSYITNLSSMLAAEASTNNGSSAASSAPLTLRSFSGLFVVVGCISAFMLLINFARSVYAKYTRERRSELESEVDVDGGSVHPEEFISTLQANGSVPDQHVQEIRDNDSQGAHGSSRSSGDEEAGPIEDSMSNGSEPVPEVSVQIEMRSTGNAVGRAL